MEHAEFIETVQRRAHLSTPEAAEDATRATLDVLCERLSGGLPSNLAEQLPEGVACHLRDGVGEPFGIEEFWDRVRGRERSAPDVAVAAFHSRAVLSVVRDTVDPDVFAKVERQMPWEFAAMLTYRYEADA